MSKLTVEFGNRLKALRIKNNESQKDLADALNVSFQSISKWETNLHLPDLLTLEMIAKHYKVDLNYFFNIDKPDNEIVSIKYKISVNEESMLSVWTDFKYQDTIAPVAMTDINRHRAGNGYLKTHPGRKDAIIIVVDINNRICFLGSHYNNFYPTCGPQASFYTNIAGSKLDHPCFIVEESYQPIHWGSKSAIEKDFEFVIPEGGFLINSSYDLFITKEILRFIIPKHYHKFINNCHPPLTLSKRGGNDSLLDVLLIAELDNITIRLEGNTIVLSKEVNNKLIGERVYDFESLIEDSENKNEKLENKIKELENKNEELENKIEELENKNEELENKNDDLENMVEDLESMIDDFENKIDELEWEIRDANNKIEGLTNKLNKVITMIDELKIKE